MPARRSCKSCWPARRRFFCWGDCRSCWGFAPLGRLLLIAFLIPAALIFHDFWHYDGQIRQLQMANFMKNITIAGGLLMVWPSARARGASTHSGRNANPVRQSPILQRRFLIHAANPQSLIPNPSSMKHFPLVAAVLEGSLVPVAIALGWLLGTPPLATVFHFDWRDTLLGVAAALPPLGLFWLCLICPWRPIAEIAKITVETLVPLLRECRLVQLAIIAALAGLGEETLFRGVVQAGAAQTIAGAVGRLARTAYGRRPVRPPSFHHADVRRPRRAHRIVSRRAMAGVRQSAGADPRACRVRLRRHRVLGADKRRETRDRELASCG